MSEISSHGDAILFLTNSTYSGVPDTNNGTDIYFISTGGLQLITSSRNPVQGNIVTANGSSDSASISESRPGGGTYVVFSSLASDLTNGDTNNTEDLFLYHPNVMTRISLDYNGNQITDFYSPSKWLDISDDGRYAVFDSTGVYHV